MKITTYLLLLALYIVTLRHKKDAPYARMVFGSVFGIFFFFIWPFVDYYVDLKGWSEFYQQIAMFSLGSLVIPIALLLLKIEYEEITGIASLATFFIFALIYYGSGIQADIKNTIAFNSDYFTEHTEDSQVVINPHKTQTFHHPVGGYQLSIPKHWQLKTDKTEWFPYYQLYENKSKTVELRPMCFSKQSIFTYKKDIDFMKEIYPNSTFNKKCFQEKQSFYYCHVTQFDLNGHIKKISWYGVKDSIHKGVLLDFVLTGKNKKTHADIDYIIKSVKPATNTEEGLNCLVITEWM